jgi:hypothetical protein
MIRVTYKQWLQALGKGVTGNLGIAEPINIKRSCQLFVLKGKLEDLDMSTKMAYISPGSGLNAKNIEETRAKVHDQKMRLHHYIFYLFFSGRQRINAAIDRFALGNKPKLINPPTPLYAKILKGFITMLFIIPELITISIAKIPTHTAEYKRIKAEEAGAKKSEPNPKGKKKSADEKPLLAKALSSDLEDESASEEEESLDHQDVPIIKKQPMLEKEPKAAAGSGEKDSERQPLLEDDEEEKATDHTVAGQEIVWANITEAGRTKLKSNVIGGIGRMFDVNTANGAPSITPELEAWSDSLLNECKVVVQGKLNPDIASNIEEFLQQSAALSMLTSDEGERAVYPCFEKNKLTDWAKPFVPDKLHECVEKLVIGGLEKAHQIAFDGAGQPQSWLYEVLKKEGVELADLMSQRPEEIKSVLYLAVITAIREALSNSALANQVNNSASTQGVLKVFLQLTDRLFSHQMKYFSNIMTKLSEFSKKRLPASNLKKEKEILTAIAEAREVNRSVVLDRLTDTSSFFNRMVKPIIDFFKTRNNQIEACKVVNEDVRNIASPPSGNIRSQLVLNETNLKVKPQQYFDITLSNNANEIGHIKIAQYQEKTKSVSNLVDITIDIPALFFKAMKENFDQLNIDQGFFVKGIEKMKNDFHTINKDAIQAMLADLNLDQDLMPQVTDVLLKTYKINLEQLDPYDLEKPLDEKPYESKDYFPSDIVIRTAAHQVDEFVKISRKRIPHVVIREAFDLHYVEAVQLYCRMKGYTFSNKTAWQAPSINSAKVKSFTGFYNDRFGSVKTLRDNYTPEQAGVGAVSLFNKAANQFEAAPTTTARSIKLGANKKGLKHY